MIEHILPIFKIVLGLGALVGAVICYIIIRESFKDVEIDAPDEDLQP